MWTVAGGKVVAWAGRRGGYSYVVPGGPAFVGAEAKQN